MTRIAGLRPAGVWLTFASALLILAGGAYAPPVSGPSESPPPGGLSGAAAPAGHAHHL